MVEGSNTLSVSAPLSLSLSPRLYLESLSVRLYLCYCCESLFECFMVPQCTLQPIRKRFRSKKNFLKIIIIFSVQKEKYCYFFLNNSETTMLFIVKTESHPHKGVACSVQGQLPNGKNMIWVWDHVLGRMMINGVNGSYRVGHRVLG